MSLLFTRHCPATPNFKGTGIISASRVYHEDQRRHHRHRLALRGHSKCVAAAAASWLGPAALSATQF